MGEEVASSLVVTMRLESDSDRRVSISCAPPSFKVVLLINKWLRVTIKNEEKANLLTGEGGN